MHRVLVPSPLPGLGLPLLSLGLTPICVFWPGEHGDRVDRTLACSLGPSLVRTLSRRRFRFLGGCSM